MPRTDPVIRLVGGPRPLDGSTYDPAPALTIGPTSTATASCGPCAARR